MKLAFVLMSLIALSLPALGKNSISHNPEIRQQVGDLLTSAGGLNIRTTDGVNLGYLENQTDLRLRVPYSSPDMAMTFERRFESPSSKSGRLFKSNPRCAISIYSLTKSTQLVCRGFQDKLKGRRHNISAELTEVHSDTLIFKTTTHRYIQVQIHRPLNPEIIATEEEYVLQPTLN